MAKTTVAISLWALLQFTFLLSLPLESESQPQTSQQQQQQQQQQLQILLKIKAEWGDPSSLQGWNESSNGGQYCSWREITCTADNGIVTAFNLSYKELSFPIPASICDLPNLTSIDLYWNNIPGPFPIYLYNCSNLQHLNISQNYFVGRLPSDIHRLSSLRSLYIFGNNFTGDIPPAIGRLSNLVDLQLHQNLFNGSVPVEISNLENLECLLLSFFSIMPQWTIPPEFGRLKKLKNLWIRNSNLVGKIPESFTNLTDLERLDLSENKLTGEIPRDLFRSLKNLQVVFLYYNKLSGEIPRPVEALGLEAFDLSMNGLTGTIPEDLGNLNNLTILFLYYNNLSGEIPVGIGRLPSLKDIRLFNNNLTGALPPELGLHSKLENFEVTTNRLSGELPEHLCRGGVLRGLVATQNNFGGSLPQSLANCSSLTTVQLSKNKFTGDVPAGLWTAENLTSIVMNDNLFTGSLPEKLAWNLSRLEISNNRFSGPIPARISDSKFLEVFTAINNQFSGNIPASLTELSQLQRLELAGNRLSGELPSVMTSPRSWLNVLDLSRNQLTGGIPPSFRFLTGLNSLNLSNNQLSGEIPLELGSLKLSQLDLSYNRLSGKIPDGFDNSAFDTSFLNNPGLCASNPFLNLRVCASQSRGSSKISPRILAMILAISGSVALVVAFLAWFVVRDYMKRKQRLDLTTWKLISFQRLDFTEANILHGLVESNLIGSGGSGKVYRIPVGNRAGDVVAVKKIWSSKSLDPNLEKLFQAEVEILGRIRHSNIVKLLCCISSDDSKLLVYEYMENESLDRWLHGKRRPIQGGPLDWPSRHRIAVGAAQGLSYMHHSCSPPIIHRDVKSSNILLDSEFKARIADFGLARMLEKREEPETMSAVAGSVGYIAPEFAYTTRVNEKCDVYSFGVVLLELATGREACTECDGRSNLVDWAWHHLQEGKELVDALDEEIREPAYLNEMSMVFKMGIICTETLPSARPSMKDVLHVLQRFGPPQNFGSKKAGSEYDVAPLLHASSPLIGCIGSGNKISSLEDGGSLV